ncbi:hypothetical protein FQN51_003842 [Onygenales sp. PD_10]|nr:hypothetical protein FQN51_003842 [Onygenales sp. PD_10]
MAANYKKYLAEQVLNEQEIVTYRSLSRALKVHSNLAKRMLYEFHRVENSKKPRSVSATYLITGTQVPVQKRPLNGHVKDGEDEVMQSSPFMSSQVAQQGDDVEDIPPVTAITLVREEDLADAKSLYQTIFSIFVHSVQPTRLQDLNVLADIGHDLLVSQPEDPLEHGRRYGMIQNKNVKRRSGLPPAPPPPAPAEVVKKPKITKTEEAPKATKKEETSQSQIKPSATQSSSKQSSHTPSSTHSQGKLGDKPSTLKRDSSNIFKAFAKAKPKAKKETPERSTPSEVESAEPSDVVLDDASEEEREDLFLDSGTKTTDKKRETRREREEKLRKMMDDEEMTDAPDLPAEEPETAKTETPPAEESPKPEPKGGSSPAPKGRRRGRRQVMKKKVTRDAEGYLSAYLIYMPKSITTVGSYHVNRVVADNILYGNTVTKEEPAWESFSEDEAPPPKRKPAVSVAPKAGKGGPKTGQGTIMSFFGKKS